MKIDTKLNQTIGQILLTAFLLVGNTSFAADQSVKAPAFVTLDAIPVCYDFGCKNGAVVNLPLTEWEGVTGWFVPQAETAEQERDQIMRAIGWMEVLIGRHTPTHKDLAFDLPAQDDVSHLFPGQQDCIDEAVNTTTYLRLFEQSGLLTHHTVIGQAYRKAILDQHWAGQVKELITGKRWVVDSWFQPNGYLPVIQASEEWEDISLFTAVVDDSRKEEKPSFWRRLLRKE
ncbi:MAG: hypothetical protein GKR96_03880 [Gammaproteobacteria bacterium]|nr:hypothetical protein [Gammaproteobacteria bacterium]